MAHKDCNQGCQCDRPIERSEANCIDGALRAVSCCKAVELLARNSAKLRNSSLLVLIRQLLMLDTLGLAGNCLSLFESVDGLHWIGNLTSVSQSGWITCAAMRITALTMAAAAQKQPTKAAACWLLAVTQPARVKCCLLGLIWLWLGRVWRDFALRSILADSRLCNTGNAHTRNAAHKRRQHRLSHGSAYAQDFPFPLSHLLLACECW